jgi:Spy/CpxP family protein refolding chaperone
MSGAAIAATAASAPPQTRSTATETKRHPRGDAAEEQKEQGKHLQKLTQRLKLTSDQAVKVKSIMEAQRAEWRELRAKYKSEPAAQENKSAMEKARADLHASTEAKLAQVLTADQMSEFKKMRAEHMKKHEREEKEEKGEAKEGSN